MSPATERARDVVGDVIAVDATRVEMFRLDFTLPGWEDYVLFAVPRETALADTSFSGAVARAPALPPKALRNGTHSSMPRVAGPLIAVDRAARTVHRDGAIMPLPPRCYDLLLTLIDRQGRAVSRSELVDAVWGNGARVSDRSVDTAIWHLRRALEANPQRPTYIRTVAKHGYRLGARIRTR